jgi:lipopolysaccharide/colanic/teichoic acid biosynthesis glycosyltransferase
MNLGFKESPMTVNESILMESRSGQPAIVGEGPSSQYFFYELVRRRSLAIRVSDRLLSIVAIILSSPLIAFAAIGIKVTSGGSAFSVQQVVGYRGLPFRAYTLRTLVDGQMTKFGKVLRATRIEYMPLFFHVLTGKMSLVGVTLRTNDTANVLNNRIDWFYKCYATKPGIVTWASVNGLGFTTNDFTDQRKQAELDLIYVLNQGTMMYFRILLRTMFDVPVAIPTSLAHKSEPVQSQSVRLHG